MITKSTAGTGIRKTIRTAAGILLLLSLLFVSAVPVLADDLCKSVQTLRVGYMNHPGFIEKQDDGSFYGYGVEYLQDICEYTGWKIEYVYASWNKQLTMLENGELDIVVMAQYTEERAQRFNYSRQPMGLLQCLLLTLPEGQTEDIEGNALACNGKTIGIQRGSRNIELLEAYAHNMGFSYKQVEYDYQDEIEAALLAGEVDIIACEQMIRTNDLRVLDRFSSDSYYIITAKENAELMDELDYVIGKLYAYDADYMSKLNSKYYGEGLTRSRPYFSKEEIEFMRSCGDVHIALIPDNKPSVYYDGEGKLTGMIPDIMNRISELCGIHFEYEFLPNDTTPYDFLQKYPDMLVTGVQADNPVFAKGDIIVSDVYHTTHSTLFGREDNPQADIVQGEWTVGTVRSFQAMQLFLNKSYPNVIVETFLTTEEGLQALVDKKIDFFTYTSDIITPYLSNPRYEGVISLDNYFMKNPRSTIGVRSPRNQLLMGIINKCSSVISDDEKAEIGSRHTEESIYRFNQSDVLDHYRDIIMIVALSVAAALAILITIILLRQRKYNRDIAMHAEYDMITGVLNHAALKARVVRAMGEDTGKSCAFIFADIDNLKHINDTKGTDIGDEAVKRFANVLKRHFHDTAIIGRIGGDDFGIFLSVVESKAVLVSSLAGLLKEIAAAEVANGAAVLRGSIGVAMGIIGECTPDVIYSHANEAHNRIKTNGKNGFAFYETQRTMSMNAAQENEAAQKTDDELSVQEPQNSVHVLQNEAIGDFDSKNIIESLPNVALYIIEKKTHKILYFNKRFREICPTVRVGMCCRGLMLGPCNNCIVDTMGEQAMAHTIFYSDFYGDEIEITATKIMWDNSTSAVMITSWPRNLLSSSSDKLPSTTNQDAFDYVTGGLSRAGFVRMMERMQKGGVDLTNYAVLFINIKDFKAVNEMAGYAAGDNLLRTVYTGIERSNLLPIIGGRSENDHFVFMVEKTSLELSTLPELLNTHWKYKEKDLFIHCRCGVFMIEDSTLEIYKILDRAKLAKEHIVDDYVKPYAVYEQSMLEEYSERASAFLLFDNGIKNKEFVVYYQPVVDAKTGKVVSAEALVRRITADGAVISPGKFIPILERTGYISMLDSFVAKSVTEFLLRQVNGGMPSVPVSFNLSQKDFYDEKLMEHLLESIKQSKLPKGMLLMEITESAYTLHEKNNEELLKQLRDAGAKILLDDFGTGYSSFGMFKNYNFDRVKLDMSFVRQLDDNINVRKVVRSIISMCHDLGVQVVAEGVENDTELTILRDMDCDFIQGYYFSKPLDEKNFVKYLSEHT